MTAPRVPPVECTQPPRRPRRLSVVGRSGGTGRVSHQQARGPAIGVQALLGTSKGLFLLRGDDDRRQWETEGPLLEGWGVYHAVLDQRDGTLYAATNHRVYSPTVQRSTDGGRTWTRCKRIGLPEESGLTLNAVWHVEPGRPEEAGTLYLGADPGVLFRSDDGGDTWEINRGIMEHPTRNLWSPGAGGMCCHSIQLDPGDPRRMYVAITSAGAFRSDDGGESWIAVNKNVVTDFLADPQAEVGACPHKLLLHPARPSVFGSRTTTACICPTITATRGCGSTGTGCRAGSGFRSCSTRRIRPRPS